MTVSYERIDVDVVALPSGTPVDGRRNPPAARSLVTNPAVENVRPRALSAASVAPGQSRLASLDAEPSFAPGLEPSVEMGDSGVPEVLQRGGGERGAPTGGAVEDGAPVGIELGT